MAKKKSPKKIPASKADVDKAWEQGKNFGVHEGCRLAMALFYTVMLDKFNAGEQIVDIWREVEKLSASVSEGRVKLTDLADVLKTEYGVNI